MFICCSLFVECISSLRILFLSFSRESHLLKALLSYPLPWATCLTPMDRAKSVFISPCLYSYRAPAGVYSLYSHTAPRTESSLSLGLMLCCHHLKIHNDFEKRGPASSFCPGICKWWRHSWSQGSAWYLAWGSVNDFEFECWIVHSFSCPEREP